MGGAAMAGRRICAWYYQEDGSRGITAFIERAVDFYLDYLSANSAGLFLTASIKSHLGGKGHPGGCPEAVPGAPEKRAAGVPPGVRT